MTNFLNQFPYSDFHEMNLDWILKEVKGISNEMASFIASNKVVYKGLWNITQQYENNDIVLDQVRGYMMISIQPVPAGIDITNTDYWLPVSPFRVDTEFDSDSYNAIANKTVTDKFTSVDNSLNELAEADTALSDRIDTTNADLTAEADTRANADDALSDRIDATNADLTAEADTRANADIALTQRINTTDENLSAEVNSRISADLTMNARIDKIASLTPGSTTGDAELQDIRVAADGVIYPTAGDAVREQVTALQDQIDAFESTVYKPVFPDQLAYITSKPAYNASVNPEGVNIQALVGYDTYFFIATSAFDLWFEAFDSPYIALCYGKDFTEAVEHDTYTTYACTDPVRYRRSENNLPTKDNPLHVNIGDFVCFTFSAGTVTPFYGFAGKEPKNNFAGTFSKTSDVLTIKTKKAQYVFKSCVDNNINLNTWRLYSADLVDVTKYKGFNLWTNSDAEGVVQINGESDFIGGYHGDEQMTSLKIYADGVEITDETDIVDQYFTTINIYVESDVYHCDDPDNKAFTRRKWLIFNNETVRIGNNWKAEENLVIASAPLALFQAFYKDDEETAISTAYMASSDYKVYQMATPAEHTPNSPDNTEFMLENKYHPIRFTLLKTSGSNPMGVVAYNFITAQNRIKFYYYTIYSNTSINAGDVLRSEFEFEIL